MELKKASEIEVRDYCLKALVYGRPGTGKTRSLRTAPKPLVIIDTDRGMLSLRDESDVLFVSVDYDSDSPNPMAWVKVEEAVNEVVKMPDIRTVALDSLTTISSAALKRALFLNRHLTVTPSLPDYMRQVKMLEDLITKVISAKKHIVVTAHEQYEKNEITGQVWCLPSVVGKVAYSLPVWFDEVYRAEVVRNEKGEMSYRWMLRSDTVYSCKSRLAAGKMEDIFAPQDFRGLAERCGVKLE